MLDMLNSMWQSKLFAYVTSSFSIVHDINLVANNLNNDLIKISKWALSYKLNFSPDPSKQPQEVILSKKNYIDHPPFLSITT